MLLPDRESAIGFWFAAYSLLAVPTVIGGTAFQLITQARVRAQVMAIYLLLMNLLALSLGPFLVAFLSDHVIRDPERLHQSLAIVMSIAALVGGTCLLLVRRRFSDAAFEVGTVELSQGRL